MSNILDTWTTRRKNTLLFVALWLLTFVMYFPAARAGWVIDGVGFLYNIRHQSFWDFINRTNSTDQSFYQLFTLHYYIFYKLWGFNVWLWSLLYITVQAINAWLLYLLCSTLFKDSGVKRYELVPLIGITIFSVSPHISEVLIGRAYFHYLLSFMFILLTLRNVLRYMHVPKTRYLWATLMLFVLAAMTLEIFYLLPFFVLTLALYYRIGLGAEKKSFSGIIRYCFIPQLILLLVYFAALVAVYKHLKPHKIELSQSATDYLSKLPKYIFHIVFLGRYFPIPFKEKAYEICSSWVTIIITYSLAIGAFAVIVLRIRTAHNDRKPAYLLFTWAMLALVFIMPLAFPRSALLVFFDRYTYFAAGFIYILIALLLARVIKNKYLAILLFCAYVDVNLYFTIDVNTSWIASNVINTNLLRKLPDPGNKTVLLLNIPENMNGAPMIGSSPEGAFKMMKEVYTDTPVTARILDVASYNMTADYNGAHITVLNDSVLKVALNHGGTWWWYDGGGAISYENADYKTDFKTVGLRYDITLKKPADSFLILYSVGDQWRKVDMSLKNKQQD